MFKDFEMFLKSPLPNLRQFLATESHLKMMKNAFYFKSKAFFVPGIFKFLFWLFVHVGKQLDKKANVLSKFMTSQTGW